MHTCDKAEPEVERTIELMRPKADASTLKNHLTT